jgi:hypothetical protein
VINKNRVLKIQKYKLETGSLILFSVISLKTEREIKAKRRAIMKAKNTARKDSLKN